MNRRAFLKNTAVFVSGASLSLSALELIDPAKLLAANPTLRWGFLVDTHKCVGCGFCVKACKIENDIPLEANVTRTWVERYVMTKNGETLRDCPKGALDGYTNKLIDQNASGMKAVADEDVAQAFFVPKLCNHCTTPACVQVCPVGATYQTGDGAVLVDRKWCIGCGYCIMAVLTGCASSIPPPTLPTSAPSATTASAKAGIPPVPRPAPSEPDASATCATPMIRLPRLSSLNGSGCCAASTAPSPMSITSVSTRRCASHARASSQMIVHGEAWTVKDLFVLPNEYVYWSIQIVMYPYMTGLVAGAFVLSSLYHVFGVEKLKEIARYALVFSFALLPVAMMPLLLHLQQPFRGIHVMMTPHFTSRSRPSASSS